MIYDVLWALKMSIEHPGTALCHFSPAQQCQRLESVAPRPPKLLGQQTWFDLRCLDRGITLSSLESALQWREFPVCCQITRMSSLLCSSQLEKMKQEVFVGFQCLQGFSSVLAHFRRLNMWWLFYMMVVRVQKSLNTAQVCIACPQNNLKVKYTDWV